ncbi:MAG: translation initiation factor IF-2 [Geminicoccaceae bacterium]
MSDTKSQDRGQRLSLRGGTRTVDRGKGGDTTVRQSFSHGRSKAVAVEVKRSARRTPSRPQASETQTPDVERVPAAKPATEARSETKRPSGSRRPLVLKPLTEEERNTRARALADAKRQEVVDRKRAEDDAKRRAEEEARRKTEEEAALKRKAEEESRRKTEEEARRKAEEQARKLLEEEAKKVEAQEKEAAAKAAAPAAEQQQVEEAPKSAPSATPTPAKRVGREEEAAEEERGKGKAKRGKVAEKRTSRRDEGQRRNSGRIELDVVEGDVIERRGPSLAAWRRRQEREKRQQQHVQSTEPQQREVVLPESITVQDLASRMAVRGGEVVKTLMKMGVMATVTQTLDADTAELVVAEFGHKVKRVAESDVEEGLDGPDDEAGSLLSRAPVVTVMGHVDHGKTSLLDALRQADVAGGEAGGITQHIGAYQVDIGSGTPVTFIDTPGHAAFTEMRARGAKVTDLVVLVVAADDGVMPQTIEAISHAKAAEVPIIVAINKVDRPEADPTKIKNELLEHDLVPEDYGGEVQCIEVSAVAKTGLDQLIEAIQLQAELLELKANPDRAAQGAIIEAKLDRGRGVVATVLVQRGTLRVGDICVCGGQWGRARALVNDHGQQIDEAGPSVAVEVLGLDGVPIAGDPLVVVESEKRARDICEYRQRQIREKGSAAPLMRGSVEDIFNQLKTGVIDELPIVVKADVHGSLEAITAGMTKLNTDEVAVRILHGAVGGITESDVTLAGASNAFIIGFNVRANAQAREMAKRDGVDIRYYSIIYELLDEVKAILSGMLSPDAQETIIGHAEIREVFNITKVGKVAGCRVVDGLVRRGSKLRLLRDDVVVYQGDMGTLKRFKDDVREVKEGFECGLSIAGYNDIRQGDVIEAFEVKEVARSL